MTTLATKLSVFAAVAFAVSACTVTSSDDNKTDSGTTTTPDSGKTDSSTTTGDTGTPDTSTELDGGTCEIVIQTQSADCDKCLNDSCCAEVNGCFGDTDCAALDKCLGDCDGKDAAPGANDAGSEQSKCIQDCGKNHQPSVSKWLTFATCLEDKCQKGSNTSCK